MVTSAFATDFTTSNDGFWTLQDSAVLGVVDQSPSGNDFVLNNGAGYNGTDNSLFTDGVNDIISNTYIPPTGTKTIAFWFKTTDTGLVNLLASGGAFGGGDDGIMVGMNTDEAIYLHVPSRSIVLDSSTLVDTGSWIHLAYVQDGTTAKLYLNGVLDTTDSSISGTETAGVDLTLGASSDGANPRNANADFNSLGVWTTDFDATQILELHDEGRNFDPYYVDPASIDTLTVNFQNALNLTNISDVIVNYDGTNYTNSTGNQVKINITTAGGNISLLQNFTVYAVDHLSQDVLNWNLSDIYVANLTQSDINYSISEIYTGNAINTFNLTLSNSTKYQTTNGTINLGLNTGSQTFLIEPLNYDAQNVSYTITAKEVSNVTFNDFANGTLELHLVQQQDTNISISAFTASFTPNGTEQVYPTSNGSVFIPVLFGDTYEFDFTSSGYFTGYENITINQSYQNETYNLSLQGGVLFTFRDSVTQNIITGELNLIVENATFSQTYTFTGGTQIVTNLTDNQEFDFYFYGAGYQTNSYFLTYQNQSEIDLYLINGSDNITYTVLTQGSEVLPDTEITIDKFLSGSWVQIASQLTDVTGRAVFGLERGITHRITFNKDGYTSRVDINRFSDTEFTVVLAESAEINFDLGFQDVRLVVSPSNSTLLPQVTNFSASITSAQALFEYILLKVYYNGTLLGQDNSTSNVGANLNVNLDLTGYNDTLIMLEYTYKVINVSEITYGTKVYKVVDTVFYEGTLLELKDRLDEKLSIGEKIALYAIVFILTLIFVSIFATGLPAVVASLLIATLAGWVFGIDIVLLLFVTATVALFSIAYAGDMI
jgi:hypothetical protein